MDELKLDGIEFLMSFKAIDKFEKQNGDININVFRCNGENKKEWVLFSLWISKNNRTRHVDFLFLTYTYIKHYC